MRTALAVVLSVALLPLAAQARGKSEEIYNPTISISSKASPAQVKKAVKLAVLSRGWTISHESAGAFDAAYDSPGHWHREPVSAKIHVTYSTKEVKIKYVSSDGLNADGNNIHPTYNNWMKMLERDIPIYVEREKTASE